MELTFTISEIREVARQFWSNAAGYKVFALHGQMGAGKTTLVHALCEVKGVTEHVTSPTFSLINEYRFDTGDESHKIFHIDLYRIRDEEEAMRAGIEDCLYSGAICFVEWPEKAPDIFPVDTVHLHIEVIDRETRALKLLFPTLIL
jgi:tRNA threonylcarbamoyladenosine biosynthesis protein TsaE